MARSPSSRDCRWKYQRRCRSPSLSACVSSFKWFKKGRNSHCDSMSTLRSIPNSADYRPSSCRSEKFTAVSPAWSIVWDQATCFGFPPPQTCETQIGGKQHQTKSLGPNPLLHKLILGPNHKFGSINVKKARISAHRSQNIRQQIKSRTGNSVSPENSLRCYDLPGKTVPTAVPCNFACCLVL